MPCAVYDQWDDFGVWQHKLTPEEVEQGGVWTIGNKVYNPSSDYPGKNNGEFLVKSWVANEKRYEKGLYPLKDHTKDNLWEFVDVLGPHILSCEYHLADGMIYHSRPRGPHRAIDIPPTEIRSWYLPSNPTSGITIQRKLSEKPLFDGWSPRYQYGSWMAGGWNNGLAIGLATSRATNPSLLYHDVQMGTLRFDRSRTGGETCSYCLEAGTHAFLDFSYMTMIRSAVGSGAFLLF